jgi:hypothetical protein
MQQLNVVLLVKTQHHLTAPTALVKAIIRDFWGLLLRCGFFLLGLLTGFSFIPGGLLFDRCS